MHRLTLSAALLLVSACPDNSTESADTSETSASSSGATGPGTTGTTEGTAEPTGTGDPSAFTFDGDRAARIAWNAPDLPYKFGYSIVPMPGTLPPGETCPQITGDTESWIVVGDGCTDAGGQTWTGTITVTRVPDGGGGVDDTFVFDAFELSADAYGVAAEGTIQAKQIESTCVFPGPNPLIADGLTMRVRGLTVENNGGYFPGAGDEVELHYIAHSYAWNGDCDVPALTGSGTVEVTGLGTFTYTTAFEGKTCSREPLTGMGVFEGSNTLTITADGATKCDQCIPWSTSDGLSGALCWPQ